ncbi:MAG: signal peptide peptidase SppA, partial [Polyangiales bacterium]
GWASLEALRSELSRVRAGGKRLVVWLPEGASNREVYVASAASTIVAPPAADISLTGVKSERHFIRRALDKIGVSVELHARKEFKSAGDGAVRDDRSPADRLQTEAMVTAIDRALVFAIAEGRGIDEAAARAIVDAGPTRASTAKTRGLIDLVGHDDDLPTLLGTKIVSARRFLVRRRSGLDRFSYAAMFRRRKVIAIVQVHGTIASGGNPLARALGPIATAEQVVADLRAAERDPRVAGVVLDVDSRGGTVTASDAIYAAARRLAAKKPLFARMGDVAASGGYYVAAAGRAIVARPLTITGSIGVVAMRPIAARLAEHIGITRDVVSRGRFADADAFLRAPTDEERALFDREIDQHYDEFVALVAASRGRSVEEVEPLARGRVWTGTDAHAQKLVDHLGGLDRAVELVRAALPDVALEDEPRVIAARLPSHRLDDAPPATPMATIAALRALADLLPTDLREQAASLLAARGGVLALMP